jgi:hypothetical protein
LTVKVLPLGPFTVTLVEVFFGVRSTAHGFTETPLSDGHLSAIGAPACCTCEVAVAGGREAPHPARVPATARIVIGRISRLMPVIIFAPYFARY